MTTRVDDRQRRQPDHHRLGRPRGPARLRLGPGHAELGRRPRPGLRLERRRLDRVPVRQRPARRERPELRARRLDRSERPEHPEHRHRRAGRHADRDPHGDQRRHEGDLHGQRQRAGRRQGDGRRRRSSRSAPTGTATYTVTLTRTTRRIRHLRRRLAHLERRHAPGAQHDRGAARAARGARRGQRDGHQRLDGHRRDERLQRHADRRGRRPGARQRHHVEPDHPCGCSFPTGSPAVNDRVARVTVTVPAGHHAGPVLDVRRRRPCRHRRRPLRLPGRHHRPGRQQRRRDGRRRGQPGEPAGGHVRRLRRAVRARHRRDVRVGADGRLRARHDGRRQPHRDPGQPVGHARPDRSRDGWLDGPDGGHALPRPRHLR